MTTTDGKELAPIEGATWTVPDYPWDRWYAHARAAGVDDDLANLGRLVMREAYQHQWSAQLARRYGWAAVDIADNPDWVDVPGAPSGVRALRPGASMRWLVDLQSCQAMIARALREPKAAREEWQRHLDTDGLSRALS